ncbi:SPOR domain-containing protein [Mucilaginibacter roseus]|uniref:SPOR domain-containing protein n=1 Tax=Mucilaginibacter roseus TaxID=1528868 RepID=A0ABS8U3S0_9SPHI|nr:SPOR domain-containing protein [Mucilaginibacter roseus]MCD8741756.1 SPOR domain-containing protein [Mucilaginibacter roseus]
MDLANYLIELLGQRGEVSIPGLGRFYYAKKSAFYNAAEGRIYPPGQTLQFDQQADNSDSFAGFISQKKNISMASAKYFVDRYVNDIIQETAIRDFAVGTKGWLRNDGFKLVFRSADQTEGSIGFGLPALFLPKKSQIFVKTTTVVLTPPPPVEVLQTVEHAPVIQQPQITVPTTEPLVPEAVAVPAKVAPEPQPAVQQVAQVIETPQADFIEDEKRGLNVWVITAIVIALLAIAGISLYMYNPELLGMDKNKAEATVPAVDDSLANEADTPEQETETAKVTPAAKAVDTVAQQDPQANMSLSDTVKTTVINPQPETEKQPVTDKATKPTQTKATPTTAVVPPAMGYPYTVIIGGSFATVEEAERCIINYEKIGLDAHILAEKGYGKKRKVVVGTYKTLAEALKEKNKLIKSKKLRGDAYTLEIKKR